MVYHVYPIEDWIEHHVDGDECTCSCPCEPSIEPVVFIHYGRVERIFVIVHNQVAPEDLKPDPWYRRLLDWLWDFWT